MRPGDIHESRPDAAAGMIDVGDRIRAHVILCWLALLLARIAENACGQAWPELRRELDKIHIGTFTGPAGTFRQRTELTKPQRDILKAL